MTNFTRPGASSSTVWMAPASTEAWRVNGLVAAAAWPSTTNASRDSIWLSRIPAPSNPAASMDRSRRMRSGIGAVPGTRRWTRTGSLIARHGIPILVPPRSSQRGANAMTTRYVLAAGAFMALTLLQPGSSGGPAQAQPAPALTGQVTSADEGLMEGVLVSVKKAGSTITTTVVTDQQGRYRFPGPR